MSLNLMSFNIRYGTANDGENRWELRKEQVFNVIRGHRPDVLGIQEALRFQLDEISGAVPGYGEIGVGRDDGKTEGEYAAILFRRERFQPVLSGEFWFSDTPEVPGSKTWGNNVTRLCTWARLQETGGREIDVYNLHLDHESQPSRVKSVEMLKSRMASISADRPVILMGDFNVGEDNPVYVALQDSLVDTFRAVQPGAKDVGTFNAFSGQMSGPKIDFIFVSRHFQTRSANILRTTENGRFPSDHFPVTAFVRL
jgi:endonuclease/exonuclease/phosphatase family metal-dependent hydrolase